MPNIMKSLSILVALPRYEGYGVTPLEAMACGVPFVASDAGYFSVFAGEGDSGVVVVQDEALTSRVVAAVVALASDPGRLGALSVAARRRAVNEFGVMSEIASIARVYEEVWAQAS